MKTKWHVNPAQGSGFIMIKSEKMTGFGQSVGVKAYALKDVVFFSGLKAMKG